MPQDEIEEEQIAKPNIETEANLEQVETSNSAIDMTDKSKSSPRIVVILLVLILALGAYFRFTGLDWDDSYHLHPDERFLTDVATLLRSTDPITYLRSSVSPLNPYNVGKTFYVYGNLPMTITRLSAEAIDTIYKFLDDAYVGRFLYFDGIHLVGRTLSALVDLISIGFVFLIGRRLYNWQAGLIASLLLAVAVLPIQQSHFFTMDNWAAALTTISIYTAVRASENATKKRWWILFGMGLGLALASRINLAPLALIAPIAALVWLAKRIDASKKADQRPWHYILMERDIRDLQTIVVGLILAALVSIIVFRITQPYAFADANIVRDTSLAESGTLPGPIETTLRSIVGLNPQWLSNLSEIQGQQSPEASFPPALQWTDRKPIIFPFSNIVLWGMGITAGLAAWLAFGWALIRILKAKPEWTSHVILVSWIGIYFLFMATRWVKSIRYFLPIYPALFLLAGWALMELWHMAARRRIYQAGVALLMFLVVVPSFLWANAFAGIYRQPVTRVEASKWMLENVPSGASVLYQVEGQEYTFNLPVSRFELFENGPPLSVQFSLPEDGEITGLRFNYLSDPSEGAVGGSARSLQLSLVDPHANETLVTANHDFELQEKRQAVEIELPGIEVTATDQINLVVNSEGIGPISVGTSVLSNEHWDDPLPVRYEGLDPFSMYYSGVSDGPIPITNPDSEEKRQSFYRWLEESDYIVLSSQRALWSLPRLPLTYPLTTRYFEALFKEELGFELVAEFQADFNIGPLFISDISGAFNWQSPVVVGWPPPGDAAAEEAFSVYDHPPVWIFAKSEDYSADRVVEVLGGVDLSNAIFMTPGQATSAPNGLLLSESDQSIQQANGTFDSIFNIDGVLSSNPGLAAIIWWLAVILLGWLTFPITFVVFNRLPDRGYPLARILSLLIISYFGWIAASLDLLPNTRRTLLIGVGLVLLLSSFIFIRKRREILGFLRNHLALVGILEVIGLGLYLLFIVVRLGNPDVWDVIWGGEKPMDLSYFNAVLKSTVFPPYDPWFAGGYINYYYYGFVYVGALTKLLGLIPTIAYNLILPMLASFTGLAAFSLAFNIVSSAENISENRKKTRGDGGTKKLPSLLKKRGIVAGFIALILAVLVGNLAEITVVINSWYQTGEFVFTTGISTIDGFFKTADGALDILLSGETAPIYTGDWFWNATRAININPGEVQPITEFPFFTFLYGDLHAHMIALPLTLLALAWALSLVLPKSDFNESKAFWFSALRWSIGALAIGVLRATNTWDFPTYLFIGAVAVGYHVYCELGRFDLWTVGRAIIEMLALVALSILLFIPFASNYGVPYSSFSLWPGSYTQVGNYLLIYGLFFLFVIFYLVFEFRSWTQSWTVEKLQRWEPLLWPVMGGLFIYVLINILLVVRGYLIAPIVLGIATLAGALSLRPGLEVQRRAVLFLISLAVALTLLVEVIVLDGDLGRMNTVFKFYLQVWLILSVASGAAAVWSWPAIAPKKGIRRVYSVVLAFLLAIAFLYPILATKAKWDIRMSEDAPATLDGMAFMESTSYADTAIDGSSRTISLNHDYEAIQWMQQNISGSPVIAEAHGSNPYRSVTNRVTMYTGLPSIVGWDWHQRQQRAVLPASLVGSRIQDVHALFNTNDTQEAMSIINKYDVSYLYVGPLEWTYYEPQGLLKFDSMVESGLLREVYRNEGVSIYEVIA